MVPPAFRAQEPLTGVSMPVAGLGANQSGYTRCVEIERDELVEAVRALNAAGRPARADTVSIELGAIAEDGGYWDVNTVADDLAELESIGKLERAAPFEWEGVGPPPKALIAYEVTGEH